MKNSIFNQWVTLFVLMIVFALKGMASSKIGEVKIDVGTSKTVQLNSAYLNTLRNYGTRIMSFSWSTSNSNITISSQSAEQAVIKGVKSGTTQLYYKCQYVLDGNYRTFDFYYDVTISGSSVTDADINFESIFLFLDEGESYTINAIQSGVAGGVYFTTDNPQVATVVGGTRNGWKTPVTVTAVGAGVTNIYANTLSGLSCSCKVTVKPLPVPATEISLPESVMLQIGQEMQLTATVSPENSTSQKTWTSDNNDVAVVSSDGLVVALVEGTANITVTTDNGLSAVCCITVLPPSEPQAYAVLKDSTFTFYYDNQKDFREGRVFEVGYDTTGRPFWCEEYVFSWVDESGKTRTRSGLGRPEISIVVFDKTFSSYSIDSTDSFFSGFINLTKIYNIEYLNVSNVTSMVAMFSDCSSLTNLNLLSFDTSNVVNMPYMFRGCSSLTSLDLSNFDTSKVTGLYEMFRGCSSLTYINLSSFDTSNVTNMADMFRGCSSLPSLDLSSFDTSKVKVMLGMFSGCSSLTSLDLSNFDISKVTLLDGMFSNCSSLTNLNLLSFDTSNVVNMPYMFRGCSSLTSLDLSNFDTSKVTGLYEMFRDCSSLTSLDLSNFDTSKVTELYGMFRGCSSLSYINLSSFDTSNITSMAYMFHGCSSLPSLDLSSFDTSKVKIMCCMFSGCSSLVSLDLSSFNTSIVNNMIEMFKECSSLIRIIIGEGWQIGEVDGKGMFTNCTNLLGEKGTTYDSEHTGYEYAHVDGGVDNPGYLTLKNEEVETDNFITITPISVFQTFCSENSLDFSKVDGLIAFIAVGYNPSTNEIMLTPIVEVPAGTGVLLKGDVGKTFSVPICSSNYKYNNSLVGVLQDTEITTGYVFDDGFKLVNSETVVPANSAYLLLPESIDSGVNSVKLNVKSSVPMKGDANGDGTVDITDVVITVNLILGN